MLNSLENINILTWIKAVGYRLSAYMPRSSICRLQANPTGQVGQVVTEEKEREKNMKIWHRAEAQSEKPLKQ
jgi:hypothetical protein